MILTVKVTPRAKKSAIIGWEGETLRVRLSAIPEKGKANEALIVLLAEVLGIAKSQIQLLHGETSRIKRVALSGITREELIEINRKCSRR